MMTTDSSKFPGVAKLLKLEFIRLCRRSAGGGAPLAVLAFMKKNSFFLIFA